VRWQSYEPAFVSVAQNLRRQARSRGAQRWKLGFDYAAMLSASGLDLFVFLTQQAGQAETFTIQVPELSRGTSQAGASVALVGAHSAGATFLSVNGTSTPTAFVIGKGEFLTVAGSAKVYMATANVTAVGSAATIPIYPRLVESLSGGAILTLVDVPFQVALSSDVPEYVRGFNTIIQPFSLAMIEAV
jgi:hypothetical protein